MTTTSTQDLIFMAHAIRLAARGQFTTSPNPNVGCVIVKDGQVIGEGWHIKAGQGHAEVNALANLTKEQSSGATAYVTLEPCSHIGRTPPCANRLIEAGIKTVVIAMLDPNPQVAGKGIQKLETANINVVTGVLESEARGLNPGFLSQMEKKRPFVQLKLACSIDGKTALGNGESKWITGPKARADVQKFRALSCAILTSAKTVIRDNARLNVRHNDLNFEYPFDQTVTRIRQPAKIILDGSNQILADELAALAIFNNENDGVNNQTDPCKPAIVIVKKQDDVASAKTTFAHRPDIKVISADYTTDNGFDLDQVIEHCHVLQFNRIWVEAGAKLSAAFLQPKSKANSLIDELIVYMAPKIMGANAQDLLPVGPFKNMSEVTLMSLKDSRAVGDDLRLTYTFA